MKIQSNLAWMTALCLSLSSPPTAFAELPVLNEAPWLGYFAGHEGRRFKFGITSRGEMKLTPLNDKGLAFGPHMTLPIQAGIEEVLPDGKAEMKTLRVDTLESKQTATDKLDRVVIQGKASAEAVFEMVISLSSGHRVDHLLRSLPMHTLILHLITKVLQQLVRCLAQRHCKSLMRQHVLFAQYFVGLSSISMSPAVSAHHVAKAHGGWYKSCAILKTELVLKQILRSFLISATTSWDVLSAHLVMVQLAQSHLQSSISVTNTSPT